LIVLAGCGRQRGPDLGGLYNRAARHHDKQRNPVIVIPGILGSRLVEAGSSTVVWGAFTGKFANPQTPEGARLFALPMREGAALGELRDDVRPDGALETFEMSLLGVPIRLAAYVHILRTLGIGGYRDELLGRPGAVDYGEDHFTCFQFAYDWRRDNVENARRLHRFILEKKAYVKAERRRRYGVTDADVKFDLVAHSMGGVLARYYLRYGPADLPADGTAPKVTWAGARHVQRAILVGPPNAGSAAMIGQMTHGAVYAPPITPNFPAAVLGTLPGFYQMLPRARHGCMVDAGTGKPVRSLYDPALWQRMDWGLARRDEDGVLQDLLPKVTEAADRRRIALEHLAKCLRRAERFAAALDRPARPPAGTQLILFAGDAAPTLATVAADPRTGALKNHKWSPGDGTVLRSSALMDERVGGAWQPGLRSPVAWHQVTFLFADHMGMTRDAAFSDNVLYLLLEAPRRADPPGRP
jgi:pimeloyl-ACP methyl ester carboxylesterase